MKPSTSCCYRCLTDSSVLDELGTKEFATNEAIEYWGGFGIRKIVMSPCANGEVISTYCFYPAEYNDFRSDGWNNEATPEELCDTFPDLDPKVLQMFRRSFDIKMWRLYNHAPYPYWVKGCVALVGDAAHPMMPDQSQGASMAMEDAAALGLAFSRKYDFSVTQALKAYERIRMPRATRLQEASRLAREDLNERIGWSKASDRPGKLTIEEVCGYDMKSHMDQIAAYIKSEYLD